MDYYFNDPATVKQILSNHVAFSSARSSNSLVNSQLLSFIDSSLKRKSLLSLYKPLHYSNLIHYFDLFSHQWELVFECLKNDLFLFHSVTIRDRFSKLLDNLFFNIYGFNESISVFLQHNKDLIITYISNPLCAESIQFLESLDNAFIDYVPSFEIEDFRRETKRTLYLNLCFVYYAAHDNTISSLLTSTKFYLEEAEQTLSPSIFPPVFPTVKLITRFCHTQFKFFNHTFMPGDRIICHLTPDKPFAHLKSHISELAFGHGIHRCPGESFVSINLEFLITSLQIFNDHNFSISNFEELQSPYFSGLYNLSLQYK